MKVLFTNAEPAGILTADTVVETEVMFSIMDNMAQVSVEVLASTEEVSIGTASKLQDLIKFTGSMMIHNLNKSAGETVYEGRSLTITAQLTNLSNEHSIDSSCVALDKKFVQG